MTNKNFLGIPVAGSINVADKRTPQRPLSDLEPLMRAVLEDPTMKAFGWTQYTPYFNDGDPCVFGVSEPWFLTTDDPDPDDVADHFGFHVGYSGHPSLGKREYDYRGNWPDRVRIPLAYEGADEARFDRVSVLSDAIESGAFNDVLLEAFGDHATVTVRASGISIDTYEHD